MGRKLTLAILAITFISLSVADVVFNLLSLIPYIGSGFESIAESFNEGVQILLMFIIMFVAGGKK